MTPPPSRRARSAPPLQRGAMTPAPWFGFWRGLLFALWPGTHVAAAARPALPWHAAARRRRGVLLLIVALLAGSAAALRIEAGPAQPDALWWTTTALMTLLFAWVGVGCATALMGAWSQRFGDHFAPALTDADAPIDPRARTAIVMPICNEDIGAVFAGLRATCESLAATGALRLFDIFVLSDTSNPALQAAEQRAFERLRAMLGEPAEGGGRLHYRWRKRRVKRKAGNVADFCRRWGRAYRYMVVLDADSTMSGAALVQLVRLMEAKPRAGILQTLPQVAHATTLHARAQQFASRVTGRLFARGMAWWQLGDAHYWGHNAILRVAPFMRHCGLARLPGRGALAGEILSHDFVEAALMGRAGFEVWMVPDLEGSWEQTPPNLLDELQRDRRWCQGNLQNLRLAAEPGWRSAHRTMFAVGAFSYLVAPLWLAFTALGLASLNGSRDTALWLLTATLLLLPRVLGVAAVLASGEAAGFGGAPRLAFNALVELLLSTLQAPLRMLAHCAHVLGAVSGLKLEWKSPPRVAQAPSWGDSTRRLGALVGLPLAAVVGLLHRAGVLGLAPMLLPLALAVPAVVLTGDPRPGRLARRLGLLRTPEALAPPRPVARAVECSAFDDLRPAAAVGAAPAGPRPAPAWRLATALAMAAVAAFALALPAPHATPARGFEALASAPVQVARASDTEAEPPLPSAEPAPAARRRVAWRERPARRIDDAVRRRALESVFRAIAAEGSPA